MPGASPNNQTTLLLVAITISVIFFVKKRCCKKPAVMKEESNVLYGTYARGWDGEGEYGEGDKVYVTDTNDYYTAS